MRQGPATGLFAGVVAAGLVILVVAAVAGPVGILTPSGRRLTFKPPTPTPTPSGDDTGTSENLREATRDVRQTADLAWLGELVIWALLLTFAVAAFLVVRHLWRDRWHPPEKPVRLDFDVLPEAAVTAALRDDVTTQLATVAEGSPRNAIVRCWLRLEEVVAAAGLPRSSWETSAEFTVRILHALDLDPRSIGVLAQLYREARFSGHELDETARTSAAAALQQLHRDLEALGVRPGTRS